jgi:hypothetical protein
MNVYQGLGMEGFESPITESGSAQPPPPTSWDVRTRVSPQYGKKVTVGNKYISLCKEDRFMRWGGIPGVNSAWERDWIRYVEVEGGIPCDLPDSLGSWICQIVRFSATG